jgi:hypothetical protein
MSRNRASEKAKSEDVFGQARSRSKMLRAGLYARVSTNDQQTLAMQNRVMREYAARRGWIIALQAGEVNSGAVRREARGRLLEAAGRARSTWCWCGGWIVGAAPCRICWQRRRKPT